MIASDDAPTEFETPTLLLPVEQFELDHSKKDEIWD